MPAGPEPRWRGWRRVATRAVARHRRVLAGLAAALAVLSGVAAVRPAPPPTVRVAVAAHDLPSGTRLRPVDVTTVALPPGAVPDGAYGPGEVPLGRPVAAPVRRGEPLTDAGLVGPGLVAGLPADQVLTSVVVPGASAWLVRPGDVVDVVAGAAGISRAPTAEVLAYAATVVAVPRGAAADSSGGRPLVLAVDPSDALALTGAALTAPLGLFVHRQ